MFGHHWRYRQALRTFPNDQRSLVSLKDSMGERSVLEAIGHIPLPFRYGNFFNILIVLEADSFVDTIRINTAAISMRVFYSVEDTPF